MGRAVNIEAVLTRKAQQRDARYIIGCCLGTACYVKGAQQIIDKFSEILGIKSGETTADGLFTIDALRCIGCGMCARARPAAAITKTDYIAPGKKKPALAIDTRKCVKCGACIATCKFGAISKQ